MGAPGSGSPGPDPSAGTPSASPGSIAARSYPGLPEGAAPSPSASTELPADPDFSPSAVWLEDDVLAVVTYGSSSCPTAPSSLEVVDGTDLRIATIQLGGEVCTADIAPTTFEIDDPEGLVPTMSYTVTFDGESESVLEPLA